MKKNKPITSQKEADAVREYLIKTAMSTIEMSREQAEKRIDALLSSNELDGLLPTNLYFRAVVDKYINTPI